MATSRSATSSDRPARWWPWALPCAALLILGDAWRWQTLHLPNYSQFAYGHLAYSDILTLYSGHNLASHHLPYLQENIEYPVVTGFVMWLTALAPNIEGYFLANALLLLLCAVGTLAILARLAPAQRLWRFALAPMLVAYGALNWDLLSVLELVAALYCVRRARFGWAGILLALGTWTKLYPGFALPVLLAYTLRVCAEPEENGPLAGRLRCCVRWDAPPVQLLTGFVAGTLALNLPVALLSWRGWSYFLTMQAGRGINPDSIWAHVPGIPLVVVNVWFAELFFFGLLWLALRTWWGDRWEPAVLLSVLVFLLFTKDYSPQYDIWVLPLLALLGCPLWLWIVYGVLDFVYYAAIFLWLFQDWGGRLPVSVADPNVALGAAVWGREIALLLLSVWGLTLLMGAVWPLSYVRGRVEKRRKRISL